MSFRLARKYQVLIAAFFVVVLADQVTKYQAVARLTDAFDHYGRASLAERLAGFYALTNLDNRPFEPGKADVRKGSHTVVSGFWDHRYVENPGSAWGLLAGVDARWRVPFFHVVTLVALGFILFFYRRLEADQRLLSLALSLVFAGAFGNYIDRVARSYVIDFIDWHWRGQPGMHWPTFNIADAAISVGVALMLLDSLISRRPAPAPAAEGGPKPPAAPPAGGDQSKQMSPPTRDPEPS